METQFYINKIPGNFHVSTHSAKRQPKTVDMAHVIHCLKFGDNLPELKSFGFETLKEKDNSASTSKQKFLLVAKYLFINFLKLELESHEYHLKIVPSIYEKSPADLKYSYQYTYAYKMYTPISFGNNIAAIWFRYDMSAITIKYQHREKHLYR